MTLAGLPIVDAFWTILKRQQLDTFHLKKRIMRCAGLLGNRGYGMAAEHLFAGVSR